MKSEPDSCLCKDSDISKHAWSSCGVGFLGQLCKCWLASRFRGGAPVCVYLSRRGGALGSQYHLPSKCSSLAQRHRLSLEERGLQGTAGAISQGVQVTNCHAERRADMLSAFIVWPVGHCRLAITASLWHPDVLKAVVRHCHPVKVSNVDVTRRGFRTREMLYCIRLACFVSTHRTCACDIWKCVMYNVCVCVYTHVCMS